MILLALRVLGAAWPQKIVVGVVAVTVICLLVDDDDAVLFPKVCSFYSL